MARSKSLLDEIEQGALDPEADLPALLRKCIALGGATGSESLRRWATVELKGYSGTDQPLPEYRKVPGVLLLDGATLRGPISSQQVPTATIPDFARDTLMGAIPFPGPIAELVEHLKSRRAAGASTINLSPPGAVDLTAYINSELHHADQDPLLVDMKMPPSQVIERIYWSVSTTAIAGIIDVVRTTLVELVAEMRAGLRGGEEIPSREIAEQAVEVAVHGSKNRVVVNTVGPSGTGSVSSEVTSAGPPEPGSRRVAFWIMVAATVIAAGAGVIVLFL